VILNSHGSKPGASDTKTVKVIVLLVVLGAAIRFVDVWRPADGSVREPWRECDISAVARNWHEEGFNILYPRIDWRGDGPGYAEMEFPALSAGMAIGYRVCGVHEEIGRVISWFASVLSLIIFAILARRILDGFGAVAATMFMALASMHVRVSNGLQPESIMMLFVILTFFSINSWIRVRDDRWLLATGASYAMAVLAKASAAHIAIGVFLVVWQFGLLRSALRSLWFTAGAICLVIPILWYLHAKSLYNSYGNSLGVSDQYHWLGLDMLTPPIFLYGIARLELLHVLTAFGPIWLIPLFIDKSARKRLVLPLAWYFAAFVFYLVSGRDSGSDWASYYHVFSVPPVALLFGAAAAFAWPHFSVHGILVSICTVVFGALLGLVAIVALDRPDSIGIPTLIEMYQWDSPIIVAVFTIGSFALAAIIPWRRQRPFHVYVASLVFVACVLTVPYEAFMVIRDASPSHYSKQYSCLQDLKKFMKRDGLLITIGNFKFGPTGLLEAYHDPTALYWTERKGWVLPAEHADIDHIVDCIKAGAVYFLGRTNPEWLLPDELQRELDQRYRRLGSCDEYVLYDLNPRLMAVHPELSALASYDRYKAHRHDAYARRATEVTD